MPLDDRFPECVWLRSRLPRALAAGLVLLAALAAPVSAGDPIAFAARAGFETARDAAGSWSPDAVLIYVENDEALDGGGAAARWGYLFYSPSLDKSRIYSIRGGKIVVAEYLDMKFEAPPLATNWIDSGAALEAAERDAGREFRQRAGGRLRTMLLMRGAFQDEDPDQTTWVLVYSAPDLPSLFVVVDASHGKVRRTWRG